jgi:hypothetical protein
VIGRFIFTVFIQEPLTTQVIGESEMNLEEYSKEKLWQLLVETVHASVMYPTHKAYIRDTILPSNADVSATELSERLGMPLGEALVILEELAAAKKEKF